MHIKLAKEAENRKKEIEEMRNIPTDLMDQVKRAGLVKMWGAKKYHGAEVSVLEVTSVIRSMSYYNGSLAWVVGITNCSSLFSGYLPEEKASNLYNASDAMVGGFAGPAGIAKVVKEGMIVSGRWSWGSGISHCSHIVGGVKIMQDDVMKATGVVFFKPSEITLHDNWHVLGLKGSHSIDYSVDKLFIPNSRFSYFPLKDGLIDAPIYRFSFLGALSLTVASVGLGIAKRAISELGQLAKIKSPFGQGKPLAQRTIFQSKFAAIQGDYSAADALFTKTIEDTQNEVEGGKCSLDSKRAVRLASCHATTLCLNVVNSAYRLAGGSSIRKENKLEELMRDMNVVGQHGMVASRNYRTIGALSLGNLVPEQLL